jgi:hypothetical protein
LIFRGLAIASLLAGSLSAQGRSGRDIVLRLYKDFAWETLIEEPIHAGTGLIDQPKEILARYFDDSLVTMLLADRACETKTRAICHLDFMPLWDAQDVGATDLKVLATKDPSEVSVTFRFAGSDEKRSLTYRLAQTPNGWRIRDIVYNRGHSLRALLAGG